MDTTTNTSAGTDTPLLRDRAFLGLTATQFLGAFNDNLFKQILLLTFVSTTIGGVTVDFQGWATLAFSVPFILFSGYAGYLSDRYSKRGVIIASKVAEIVIMVLGLIGFIAAARFGMPVWLIAYFLIVLFAMGGQSAFFGPGKYGVLPELFRRSDLPQANSLILMTTFLAIILGSALAGWLKETLGDRLWVSGSVAVGIAALGTWTAWQLRRTPPVAPHLRFNVDCIGIPAEIRQAMRSDAQLTRALIATSLFWTAAALVQLSVNAVGKNQLGLSDFHTSLMVTGVSVGIALGGAAGSKLLGHSVNLRAAAFGGWMVIGSLIIMAIPGASPTHWLGFRGMLFMLVVLGTFTAIFSIPLQVLLQSCPEDRLKGRVIATQNLLNWVGICAAALIYSGTSAILKAWEAADSWGYLVTAAILVGMMLFSFPHITSKDTPTAPAYPSSKALRRVQRDRQSKRTTR